MTFKHALIPVVLCLLLLWIIQTASYLHLFSTLNWGIQPLNPSSLTGIFTAPLVHTSWQHVMANSLPLLVLGTALRLGYPKSWFIVLTVVWLGSGLGVWLFARPLSHVGASGLTHGFMFFIFVAGIRRKDKPSTALAMIVFFMYGGMVLSILPQDATISFEYHFFGALMGILSALLLWSRDPISSAPQYDWENEDDEVPVNREE